MSGNFLSCSKAVKDPLRFRREGRFSLGMPQQKTASSRLEGRTSLFFSSFGSSLSSYDGDLRDPFAWPQERPVSVQVERGPFGYLSSRCRFLSPHLEPKLEPEVSSPVLAWFLGFLWSLSKGVRPRFLWLHARPLSSRAVAAVSGLPST